VGCCVGRCDRRGLELACARWPTTSSTRGLEQCRQLVSVEHAEPRLNAGPHEECVDIRQDVATFSGMTPEASAIAPSRPMALRIAITLSTSAA
jgi:hypothetical protein